MERSEAGGPGFILGVGEHSENIQPYTIFLIPFVILKVTPANQ